MRKSGAGAIIAVSTGLVFGAGANVTSAIGPERAIGAPTAPMVDTQDPFRLVDASKGVEDANGTQQENMVSNAANYAGWICVEPGSYRRIKNGPRFTVQLRSGSEPFILRKRTPYKATSSPLGKESWGQGYRLVQPQAPTFVFDSTPQTVPRNSANPYVKAPIAVTRIAKPGDCKTAPTDGSALLDPSGRKLSPDKDRTPTGIVIDDGETSDRSVTWGKYANWDATCNRYTTTTPQLNYSLILNPSLRLERLQIVQSGDGVFRDVSPLGDPALQPRTYTLAEFNPTVDSHGQFVVKGEMLPIYREVGNFVVTLFVRRVNGTLGTTSLGISYEDCASLTGDSGSSSGDGGAGSGGTGAPNIAIDPNTGEPIE